MENLFKALYTFCSAWQTCHSDTNSASPGSILAMQQLRAKAKSLTFPPLSIARYSFIQLSQLWRQWRERKCPIFETVTKRDSNPGSLDCESGILPLSYRALWAVIVDGFCYEMWRTVITDTQCHADREPIINPKSKSHYTFDIRLRTHSCIQIGIMFKLKPNQDIKLQR